MHSQIVRISNQTFMNGEWAGGGYQHTNLFGGLLGAVIDPPAQARTPAGNMSSNLKLPCHRVAHDSAGDICRHLGDGAF